MNELPMRSDFDPYDPAVLANPRLYERVADVPMFRARVSGHSDEVIVAAGYEAARRVLARRSEYTSREGLGFLRMDAQGSGVLPTSEGQEHRRFADVLRDAMSQKVLERTVQPAADRWALEAVTAHSGAGEFDATTLATGLVSTALARLIGVDEAKGFDTEAVKRFSRLATMSISPWGEQWQAQLDESFAAVGAIFGTVLGGNAAQGSAGSAIGKAFHAGTINEFEASSLVLGLLVAGMYTPAAAIAHAFILLSRHGAEYDKLMAGPSLDRSATDEILRHASSFRYVGRTRVSDGTRVVVALHAANHDPQKWTNPYAFDITRRNAGDHLALGLGEHRCMGQPLMYVLFRSLLGALRQNDVASIHLTGEPRLDNEDATVHAFEFLPVKFAAR